MFSLIRRRETGDREIPKPVRGPEQAEVCRPRKEETVPLYGKVTAGVVVEAVANGIVRNWLFEMVLGLAVFAAAVMFFALIMYIFAAGWNPVLKKFSE